MKRYTAVSTITESNLKDFHNSLIKEVEAYQIGDFLVELQYSYCGDSYSALILQYKEM
jgi:hypothetical protein